MDSNAAPLAPGRWCATAMRLLSTPAAPSALDSLGRTWEFPTRGWATALAERACSAGVLRPPNPKPNKNYQRTGKRGMPQAFPHKMAEVLNTDEFATIIRWNRSGRTFSILDQRGFVERVCPTYFQHSKWTSFQRQLNLYMFKVVKSQCGPEPVGAYYHEFFRSDNQDLDKVRRKPQANRTTAPPKALAAGAPLQGTVRLGNPTHDETLGFAFANAHSAPADPVVAPARDAPQASASDARVAIDAKKKARASDNNALVTVEARKRQAADGDHAGACSEPELKRAKTPALRSAAAADGGRVSASSSLSSRAGVIADDNDNGAVAKMLLSFREGDTRDHAQDVIRTPARDGADADTGRRAAVARRASARVLPSGRAARV